MLFQTSTFLWFLCLVFLALIVIRPQRMRVLLLVLASWFFYACWEPAHLVLLVYCTLADYLIGLALEDSKSPRWRRTWLVVSLASNLGLLAFFKYADLLSTTANSLTRQAVGAEYLPVLQLSLPVGISFFTFHSLGYNIDVYRRKTTAERSLLAFALYVAYFPQLVAGPILRAKQFLPQLAHAPAFSAAQTRSGVNLFLVGLFKKVVVADNVAPFPDAVFAEPYNIPSLGIVLATFCFGVQIYCDFSGYTDMARGVSRTLGFEIPLNFSWPYLATSITDFWRRWHISLSSWLRDYLYIPLGGNRGSSAATYRNLLTTMVLGGLWHGATLNFGVWGLYQGVLLAIERLARSLRGEPEDAPERTPGRFSWLGWTFRWLICQYFVFLGWLIFRIQDPEKLRYCLQKYVVFDGQVSLGGVGLGLVNPFLLAAVLLLFVTFHLWSYRVGGLPEWLDRQPRWRLWPIHALGIAVIIALWPHAETAFIYFRF
ncbi:MAG: MBOAT family O-acyltransferase [Pirellulales bacterium]